MPQSVPQMYTREPVRFYLFTMCLTALLLKWDMVMVHEMLLCFRVILSVLCEPISVFCYHASRPSWLMFSLLAYTDHAVGCFQDSMIWYDINKSQNRWESWIDLGFYANC